MTEIIYNLLFLQALEWIHDTGEFYLSTHTSTGSSIHHTQELLKEHEDFQITAKVQISCAYFCACTLLRSAMRPRSRKQHIVLTSKAIVVKNKLLCPLSNTLIENSPSLPLYLCFTYLSITSLNVSLLTANQRASEAVDTAGGWVLWQRPLPCPGDKEMGVLSGQTLQGLLYPYGQIPNLPGNGSRHFFWLQQGCEYKSVLLIQICCLHNVVLFTIKVSINAVQRKKAQDTAYNNKDPLNI